MGAPAILEDIPYTSYDPPASRRNRTAESDHLDTNLTLHLAHYHSLPFNHYSMILRSS